jgi:hypothetical protein
MESSTHAFDGPPGLPATDVSDEETRALLHELLGDWDPDRVCLLQAGFPAGAPPTPPRS